MYITRRNQAEDGTREGPVQAMRPHSNFSRLATMTHTHTHTHIYTQTIVKCIAYSPWVNIYIYTYIYTYTNTHPYLYSHFVYALLSRDDDNPHRVN